MAAILSRSQLSFYFVSSISTRSQVATKCSLLTMKTTKHSKMMKATTSLEAGIDWKGGKNHKKSQATETLATQSIKNAKRHHEVSGTLALLL